VERSYYDEYFFFEQDNWWFVSRRRILFTLLRRLLGPARDLEILDAGCGTGINLAYLEEFGRVTGVDVSEDAIRFCRRRGHENAVEADLRSLPWEDGRFDLVTALDVIEHIEEDARAIRDLVRVTKRGGHLLVTVPAFPSLWSEHDEINHHRRRYRRAELRELLEREGMHVDRMTYMNTLLFPAAWMARTWQQLRRRIAGPPKTAPRTDFVNYHPVVNGILTAVFTAETPVVSTVGMPFGLSLVAVARKP
jgi:SAM-dependent methyltransferase